MRTKIEYILLLMLSFICAVSCVTDDNYTSIYEQDKDGLYLVLDLPEATRIETRADDNDPDINKDYLHLFLFKGKGEGEGEGEYKGELLKHFTPDDLIEIEKNKYKVDTKGIEGIKREGEEIIFSIAIIDKSKEDNWTVNNKAELKGQKFELKYPTTNYIPAYGEVSIIMKENTGTRYGDPIEVTLTRSVASFDFVTKPPIENSPIVALNFEFSEVHMQTDQNTGFLMPQVDKNTLSEESQTRASETEQPYPYEVKDNKCQNQIFIPEMGNDKVVFVLKGKMAGDKDNDPTFYRFDLSNLKENKDIDIKRNHKYIITIKGVTGEGYKTLKAAFESDAPNNINVDVVVWDEGITTGYVIRDKYIGLDTSPYTFENAKVGDELKIDLQTNYGEVTAEIDNEDYKVKVSKNKEHLIVTVKKNVNLSTKIPCKITIKGKKDGENEKYDEDCIFYKEIKQTKAYDKMNIILYTGGDAPSDIKYIPEINNSGRVRPEAISILANNYKLFTSFITEEKNFGPNADVKGVKINEQFKLNDNFHIVSNLTSLKGKIESNKCDILIVNSDPINYENQSAIHDLVQTYSNFIEKGVLIYMASGEGYFSYDPGMTPELQALINKVFDLKEPNNNKGIDTSKRYWITKEPYFINFTEQKSDNICSGPFGEVTNNMVWYTDINKSGYDYMGSSIDVIVKNVNIVTYSNRKDAKNSYDLIFKHPTKNFFFISSKAMITGNTNENPIGFRIDNKNKPTTMTIQTENGPKVLANSIFFGNVMAWAIEKAQEARDKQRTL